jgi:plastocyanin
MGTFTFFSTRRKKWCVSPFFVLLACGGGGGESKDPTCSATTEISIAGMAFSPSCIRIAAGDTVTWTNNDNDDHTVTADDHSFDSLDTDGDGLQNGQSFQHQFNDLGNVGGHCEFHSDMTFEVRVQ